MTQSVAFSVLRVFCLAVIYFVSVNAFGQGEKLCRHEVSSASKYSATRTFSSMDDQTLYIPVVFHIVYSSQSQNISAEQIQSQLAVINEDFSRSNPDASQTAEAFRSVAGNPHIQFFLAKKDGITGITRTATTHAAFTNDDLHLTLKGGMDAWDSNKFLNIWVAELGGQLFGYGASPGTPSFRDGVAVHYQYFGRHPNAVAPYNLGRTLTHEIGHWLGLQHVWGNGGCDSTDGIDDTPTQDNPVSGCNVASVSCGTASMVQNYMNSSTDACMNLFTIQQSTLMRKTLVELRPDAFSTEHLVTALEENSGVIRAIFPNPLRDSGFITIQFGKDRIESVCLYVMDMQGRIIRKEMVDPLNEELKIDMSDAADGFYFAHASSGNHEIKKKIIIHRNF